MIHQSIRSATISRTTAWSERRRLAVAVFRGWFCLVGTANVFAGSDRPEIDPNTGREDCRSNCRTTAGRWCKIGGLEALYARRLRIRCDGGLAAPSFPSKHQHCMRVALPLSILYRPSCRCQAIAFRHRVRRRYRFARGSFRF